MDISVLIQKTIPGNFYFLILEICPIFQHDTVRPHPFNIIQLFVFEGFTDITTLQFDCHLCVFGHEMAILLQLGQITHADIVIYPRINKPESFIVIIIYAMNSSIRFNPSTSTCLCA